MRVETGCWLLVLWLLAWTPWAWAGIPTVPVCPADTASLASAQWMGVVKDGMTPDEVARLPQERFEPLDTGSTLRHDVTDWWLRVALRNDTGHACQRWLQVGAARLRDVRVYTRHGEGWHVLRSGSSIPVREWALPVRMPVFPVVVEPHATATVLAHVHGRGVMLSLMPQVWNPDHFQEAETMRSLRRGLTYGGILVLAFVALVMGVVYRRMALCVMALGEVSFVAFVMVQNNYFLMYFWPDSPRLNLWVELVCGGLFPAAAWTYFGETLQLRRIGKWWARLFFVVVCAFLLSAVPGGLTGDVAWSVDIVLVLQQVCRWLLLIALVITWRRGWIRSWYPVVLVGYTVLRSVLSYSHLLGVPISPPSGTNMFVVPVIGGGLIMLGVLIYEVYAGHRQQQQARRALDHQRESENQRLERLVARRTQDLGRALEARSRLLGHISHDLRSPLTGILASVDLWRVGDTRRDYAATIKGYVRQQVDLIDELLDGTRSELADLQVIPEPGYVHAFLADVAAQAELLAARRDNRFGMEVAADIPARVHADFHRLRRVLFNLLGNAAKFTEHGSIHLAVQSCPASTAGRVGLRFVVDDDGPGIAVEDRERLVKPYVRGDRVKNREGFGLGLAIVVSLLERMGSKLVIDDVPGGGARFRFTLELEPAADADMQPLLEGGDSLDVDGTGKVVLVVDDDRQLRELASDLLNGYGFDAETADGFAEAADILHERNVNVVVTDQYMGGVGGWELLRHIRASHPALPVVLYSAMPAQRPTGIADTLDFDAVMLKPARGSALVRLIASVMEVPRAHVAAFGDPGAP